MTLRDDSKVGSPAKERLNLGSWGGEEGEERGEEGGDGGRDKKELVGRRQRQKLGDGQTLGGGGGSGDGEGTGFSLGNWLWGVWG